jgi:hypothetical protein
MNDGAVKQYDGDVMAHYVRDCAARLKDVATNAWDGYLTAKDANELYNIVADLRDIARRIQHGPQ